MGRKAFLDPSTKVLKAFGYQSTNDPGDVVVDVDDSFSLKPSAWRFTELGWSPYSQPPTKDQLDAEEIKADAAIAALKAMSPSQAKALIMSTVTASPETKQMIATMAAVLCVIARRI